MKTIQINFCHPWMNWAALICKGKQRELNSDTILTKTFNDTKPQNKSYPTTNKFRSITIVLSNVNPSSWEEKILISSISEKRLTSCIVVMDHNMFKL